MIKSFKQLFCVAALGLSIFALSACTSQGTEKTTQAADTSKTGDTEANKADTSKTDDSKSDKTDSGKKVKVGYVINNLNDTFQTYILEAAKKYAEENGIELEVQDSQEDTIKQLDHVNALIEKGVDAVVVVPTDTSGMDPVTEAAQKAGIPLAYVNRNPYAGKEEQIPDNVFYVGSNEKTGGQMQMEYIGEQIGGKGGIVVLMGILGNEGTTKRTEGVEEVIKEKYPDVKVLAKESGNWQRDEGLSLTENFITAYGDQLTAVIANNDEMALGAVEALKNNNLLDKVAVTGIDATPDALSALKAGELTCTIFQDANGQGTTAIKSVHEAVKGNAPKEKVMYIPFKLVTKDNVDEFMK